MIERGTRGKLKQPRLGGLQLRALQALALQKAEADQVGLGRDGSLTYRDLLAQLQGYVVLGNTQWLPSVHAQMLRTRGELPQGALFMATTALAALEVVYKETLQRLDGARSPGASDWLAVEGAYLYERRARLLDQLRARLRPFLRTLQEPSQEQATEEEYQAGRDFMEEVARLAAGIPFALDRVKGLKVLSSDQEAQATSLLSTQQASLSRALRLLRENDLVEKQEYHLTLEDGLSNGTETRYSITQTGLRRLQETSG